MFDYKHSIQQCRICTASHTSMTTPVLRNTSAPDDAVNALLPSLESDETQSINMLSFDGKAVKSTQLPLTEYYTGALFDISPNPSIPMGSKPLPIDLALSASEVSTPFFVIIGSNATTDIVLTFPMTMHGIHNNTTLSIDSSRSDSLEPCAGTLSDGIDDGETVIPESLGTQVF